MAGPGEADIMLNYGNTKEWIGEKKKIMIFQECNF